MDEKVKVISVSSNGIGKIKIGNDVYVIYDDQWKRDGEVMTSFCTAPRTLLSAIVDIADDYPQLNGTAEIARKFLSKNKRP